MNIYALREKIGQEIVDYNQLKAALQDYAHPRGKITTWLSAGELIRVKKGLYVFGPSVARGPYSSEVLANLVYGPSAISLEYALSYYGLIPERVHTLTSVTNKRNKTFQTPVGDFTYRYLNPEKYSIGIQLLSLSHKINILIATPEKALCDYILLSAKNAHFRSQKDLENFLLEDLRIDDDSLKKMDLILLNDITVVYKNVRLTKFTHYFNQWIK